MAKIQQTLWTNSCSFSLVTKTWTYNRGITTIYCEIQTRKRRGVCCGADVRERRERERKECAANEKTDRRRARKSRQQKGERRKKRRKDLNRKKKKKKKSRKGWWITTKIVTYIHWKDYNCPIVVNKIQRGFLMLSSRRIELTGLLVFWTMHRLLLLSLALSFHRGKIRVSPVTFPNKRHTVSCCRTIPRFVKLDEGESCSRFVSFVCLCVVCVCARVCVFLRESDRSRCSSFLRIWGLEFVIICGAVWMVGYSTVCLCVCDFVCLTWSWPDWCENLVSTIWP